ncbi:hypothetical protein TorRG33x02_272250 [Trema orientale]|uniref:Uncharacterized protein n=1 Tax=Trema orientale TaxID=63057 RepID=A0A2P5CUT8_TREOI|nr:hypothetical protein TorRG33x02_272250 [Trema orientale]
MQNYLAAAHQCEQVLLAQRDTNMWYYDKQMHVISNALSTLVSEFQMPIRLPIVALIIPPMPPALRP